MFMILLYTVPGFMFYSKEIHAYIPVTKNEVFSVSAKLCVGKACKGQKT